MTKSIGALLAWIDRRSWNTMHKGCRSGLNAACARLIPRPCLLCESPCGAAALCPPCQAFLPGARRRRCRICARPWQTSDCCASCRTTPPAYDASFAAADYAAPLDRAITSLKFGGQIGLASGLGGLLAAALGSGRIDDSTNYRTEVSTSNTDHLSQLDFIVPIPLSGERLAQRGFNQARLIAASMLRRAPRTQPLRRCGPIHPCARRCSPASAIRPHSRFLPGPSVRPTWTTVSSPPET